MPTQLLSIGMPWQLIQQTVYALPVKPSILTSTAACEQSVDGGTWTALTSGGMATGKFIRCQTTSAIITLSPASGGGGGSSIGPTTDLAIASLAVGTNPAQVGVLRLPNDQPIKARNNLNTTDVDLVKLDTTNTVIFPTTSIFTGNVNLSGGQVTVTTLLSFQGAGALFTLDKRTAPAGNPPAQRIWIWAEDNAGKCKLMCKFATGVAIQIAAEV